MIRNCMICGEPFVTVSDQLVCRPCHNEEVFLRDCLALKEEMLREKPVKIQQYTRD
jgi:hypothetical protein